VLRSPCARPVSPAAVIHLDIPRSRIRTEIRAAIQELVTVLAAQGLRPAGPLFARHLKLSSTGARIPRSLYEGPCEGLFLAWSEFDGWMDRQGLAGRGDLWVTGPEASADPETWRTELCLPLREEQEG
jgi:hypothetical protein